MKDKDVLIFTCSCNDLCHNNDYQIDGMVKGKLNAKETETVYDSMKIKLCEFVDEVTRQTNKGNVHVLVLGGRAASWDTGQVAVNKMWNVIVSRLRRDVDEHIMKYWSADCWPRLIVVSGAPLFAKSSIFLKTPGTL